MAMTYSTLIAAKTTAGSIKSWVNYSKLDVEQVLDEAQALIVQTLRVREMRALDTSLTMAVGDSYKALPPRFLDPIRLWSTNNIRFSLKSEAALLDMRAYDDEGALVEGDPTCFAIFDEALQFEAKFSEAATLQLLCFKWPERLGASNESNWLTDRYPHLLRQACLAKAYEFMKQEAREQMELQKLVALIDKTNAESDLSYRGLEHENSVE
jgi:hypothetical protein